jgi:coenzyme F420-reducing hydrogenase gamma subunit
MDERAVEKVSEIKTAYHRLIRGMVEDWFKMHFGDASNKALTLAATDVDAIVRLVKLDLVLLGAPDTIRQLEGTVVHQVDENIRALSTEDLKAIVNARKERKELPAADVIVHVEKIAPEATTLAETVSEEKH